ALRASTHLPPVQPPLSLQTWPYAWTASVVQRTACLKTPKRVQLVADMDIRQKRAADGPVSRTGTRTPPNRYSPRVGLCRSLMELTRCGGWPVLSEPPRWLAMAC